MAKKNTIASIVLLATIIVMVAFSAYNIVYGALHGETNVDLIEFAANPCQPIPMNRTDRMAVVRIDDIQAYAWADIAQVMVRDAHERGMNPVLGVIPQHIEQDEEMYHFLRTVRCRVELALHGWGNQDTVRGEFADLSRSEADDLISRGARILKVLARKDITTFIPPNNELSDATAQLLADGDWVVSSEGDGVFDYTVTTYDFPNKRLVPISEVTNGCEAAFSESRLCVIMLHPQDFAHADGSLNVEAYENYRELLEYLQSTNTSVVTFEFLKQSNWPTE